MIFAFPWTPTIGMRYEGELNIGKAGEQQVVNVPYVVLREATVEEWAEEHRDLGESEEFIQENITYLRQWPLYDVGVD